MEVLLPSAETRSLLLAGAHQPVALQRARHVQLRDVDHVVAIVTCIINLVLDDVFKHDKSAFISLSASHGWATQMLSRLGNTLGSEKPTNTSHGSMNMHGTHIFLNNFLRFALAALQGQSKSGLWIQVSAFFTKSLVNICDRLPKVHTLSNQFQRTLANAFVAAARFAKDCQRISVYLQRHIGHFVHDCLEDTESDAKTEDYSSALELLKLTLGASREHSEIETNRPVDIIASVTDEQLRANARYLVLDLDCDDEWTTPRPTKRRRLDGLASRQTSDLEHETYSLQAFARLFGSQDNGTLKDLEEDIAAAFESLHLKDQSAALIYIARLPCHNLAKQAPHSASRIKSYTKCKRCLEISIGAVEARKSIFSEEQWMALLTCLTKTLDSTAMQSSKSLQVLTLFALQSLMAHTPIASQLDVVNSKCGQWCLQKLRSSSREVRLAAVGTLPGFLSRETGVDEKYCKRNRVLILDFLRQTAESTDIKMSETIILALGKVARNCENPELHLVLLQLVELLGHSNALVSALANTELKALAQFFSRSTEELFRPFWQTVTVIAVREFPGQPQRTQQLCDVLGMSVDEFLVKTQTSTVPSLVAGKRLDALERIADACGNGNTVWSICTQSRNLAGILALLFAQQPQNAELLIQESFSHLNKLLEPEDVQSLCKSEPILVPCSLLQTAGEAADHEKTQVNTA